VRHKKVGKNSYFRSGRKGEVKLIPEVRHKKNGEELILQMRHKRKTKKKNGRFEKNPPLSERVTPYTISEKDSEKVSE
jgi:hypothetical protein